MIEIYPQLVVGGFQTVSREHTAQYYPQITKLAGPSVLLQELQALREQSATLERYKEVARTAATTRQLIMDPRRLVDAYSAIERIAVCLDEGKFEHAISTCDCDEHEEKLLDLADTLIAALVLNDDPLLIETAHRLLKVFWIRKAAEKGHTTKRHCGEEPTPYPEFVRRFWKSGAISIPLALPAPQKGAWPAVGYLHGGTKAAPPQQQDSSPFTLKALCAAKADIDRRLTAQLEAKRNTRLTKEEFLRRPERPDDTLRGEEKAAAPSRAKPADRDREYQNYLRASDARVLSDASVKQLSSATREILASAGIAGGEVDVAAAHSAIDQKIAEVQEAIPRTRATLPVVQLGGVVVEATAAAFSQVICEADPLPCHCDLLRQLAAKHGEKPQVSLLGTGRAYRVRQTLKRYLRSELVGTEPVLGQTKRSVSFRELDRVEQVDETITSREMFQETESTTHDQFEFASEVSKQTEEEASQSAGMTATGSYGLVTVSATASVSSSQAASEAAQHATKSAKEVINKAVKRIQEKVQQRRSMTHIRETERKNSFDIDNVGRGSFTGFYFAIDKEYENRLVNVGERLMIRIGLQQSAAFLLHCMASMKSDTVTFEKPIPPSELNDPHLGNLTSFKDINESNYALWGSLYGAEGLKPPPANVVVSHAQARGGGSDWESTTFSMTIPGGYEADHATVRVMYSYSSDRYMDAFLGRAYFTQAGADPLTLDKERDTLTGTMRGYVQDYTINFVVTCTPAAEAVDAWRIEMFNAVMEGYAKKKSVYESRVSVAGVDIQGRNPLQNKMLIEQELQKFVLGALYPPFYYRGFDSIKFSYECDEKGAADTGSLPVPEPDFKAGADELPWITFFLQLFEWKNMTYKFLPYSFGRREQWCTLRRLQDVDQAFEDALTAGYVVVDIPVAPRMTEAFMHFYNTQQIWNGGGMPVYGDPMFQEIAIAIRDSENMSDGEEVGDPWTTIVPTPLVYVQDDVPADL